MQSASGFNSRAESVRDAGTQVPVLPCRIPAMDFETASELPSDDCRRAVVEALRDESPISRRRLADRLAARCAEAHGNDATESPDSAARCRTRVALHHVYLPRLADAGLIEYDDETVAATPELERFVELVGPFDRAGGQSVDSEPAENPTAIDGDDLRDWLMAFYA